MQDLEEKYPQLLAARDGLHFGSGVHLQGEDGHHLKGGAHQTLTDTTTVESGTLDLATVMKAAQTISGEIVLETLLDKMMRIMVENAGADHGMLLFEEEGQWVVKAGAVRELPKGMHPEAPTVGVVREPLWI